MFICSVLLFLLIYTFVRNTNLDEDIKIKFIGLGLLILSILFQKVLLIFNLTGWHYNLLVYVIQSFILLVYLVFYNNDVFSEQLRWFVPLIVSYILILIFKKDVSGAVIFSFICLWIIVINNQNLKKKTVFPLSLMSLAMICVKASNIFLIGIVFMVVTFDQYASSIDSESSRNMELFQRKLFSHQYEEIKEIYMNMRGWRHDYHNHIQAMKAYLSMNQFKELETYLYKLEKDLDEVDNLVRSGNIMMDAILNSKISIMIKKDIKVDFKVVLPEKLKITDVDLCVMVSNLLENAIEACDEISVENRFVRIFCEVHGSQFYLSIQNSAKDELDFNSKNYITNKRGEHGFGMKRVQFLVDKYDGFLNLQNEPGIFAAEISIPF